MSNETNPAMKMLREFQDAFSASEDINLWHKLIAEEAKEVHESLAATLKEFVDLAYVTAGYCLNCDESGDVPPEHQELLDYASALILTGRETFGDPIFAEAFRRVHRSNMSKLGEDGKPILREDGKVLKGPNYTPPDLSDLISSAAPSSHLSSYYKGPNYTPQDLSDLTASTAPSSHHSYE